MTITVIFFETFEVEVCQVGQVIRSLGQTRFCKQLRHCNTLQHLLFSFCHCQDSSVFLDTAPCYVHTAQVNDEISLDSRARPKAKGKAARKMVDVPQNCLTPVGYFAKISFRFLY